MKLKNLVTCFFLDFMMVSCIQGEAPNAEADIITCTVPGDVLNRDPIVENKKVTLIVKTGTGVTALAPKFTLTPRASIVPTSGTILDFTIPQHYEVTSKDGEWERKYGIEVTFSGVTNTMYHFKNIKLDSEGKYHIFYETDAQGKETMTWAGSDAGFVLTGVKAKAEEYPTNQAGNGVEGKCLKLATCETGHWGSLLGMPIAAGNLFLGSFKVKPTDALRSTKFRTPFSNVPTPVTGYYKYKTGKLFQIDGKPMDNKKDVCDIYAVFYETDKELSTLDGTNVLAEDSTYIASVAWVKGVKETDEWIKFDLPFEYHTSKSVDMERLKVEKYNLAVVFSSSVHEDHFEGAPGSTLYIDEVLLNFASK